MRSRKKYLDYTKGLAILLMLFAHTMSNENVVHTWIFSFHMPIFFVVSGILTADRWSETAPSIDNCIMLCRKRLFQLGIPYFFWGTILSVFYTLLSVISGAELQVGIYLFKLISLQGIDSLWFIPCFFVAELLVYLSLISESAKRIAWGGIGGTVLFVMLGSDNMPELWISQLLLKIFVGFSFAYMGYWFGKQNVVKKLPTWAAVLGLLAGSILALMNGAVGIGALEFQNGLLFYINAIVISISILTLFCSVEEKKYQPRFLNFLGKNTIVLLCTNNLFIEIVRLLDYKITGNMLISLGMLGCVLFTILLLFLEVVTIYVSYTPLGVVFGKRRK